MSINSATFCITMTYTMMAAMPILALRSKRRVEEMKWISVNDSLPKNESVLVLFDDGECAVGKPFYLGGNDFEDSHEFTFLPDDLYDKGRVTHWMPLPPPPSE